MGNNAAALKELAKAPFNSEIDDYWALVMDAKFFYLYVMLEAGLPISSEQWAEIPDDYISLMPTGARVSKQQLADIPNAEMHGTRGFPIVLSRTFDD